MPVDEGAFQVSLLDAEAMYPDAPSDLIAEYARREAILFESAVSREPGWSWFQFDEARWDLDAWFHDQLRFTRASQGRPRRANRATEYLRGYRLGASDMRIHSLYQSGHKINEIAEMLHRSPGSVRMSLVRSRTLRRSPREDPRTVGPNENRDA